MCLFQDKYENVYDIVVRRNYDIVVRRKCNTTSSLIMRDYQFSYLT